MEEITSFLGRIPEMLEEDNIIMFLVDGLGSNDLNIPSAKKKVYQTVFPTTTTVFLYTFHSLLRPEEHGFLGWYMRFKDSILSIPPWKDVIRDRELRLGTDINRDEIFPFKSLSEILSERGFTVLYYTPFAESTFTRAVSGGARVEAIQYLSQVFPLGEADFTFIYWPSIDSILHERYMDEAFEVELEMIELFLKILIKKMPKKTRLYVFSDHGLTLCNQRRLIPIIDSVTPVGGGRVAFYKDLDKGEVEHEIRKRNIPADVFYLQELDYFKGEINPRCYENYGEIIVIARDHACFRYPFERKEKQGLGVHGGLSTEERIIYLWEYKKAN